MTATYKVYNRSDLPKRVAGQDIDAREEAELELDEEAVQHVEAESHLRLLGRADADSVEESVEDVEESEQQTAEDDEDNGGEN